MNNTELEKRKKENQQMPKQHIVIRKDLNMTPEKMSVQVAHASMGAFFEYATVRTQYKMQFNFPKNSPLEKWLNKRFTKIALEVKNEDQLLKVYNKAKQKGLPVSLIEDAGLTEFNGIPTKTCLAIGPCEPEEFKGITNRLQIYKTK